MWKDVYMIKYRIRQSYFAVGFGLRPSHFGFFFLAFHSVTTFSSHVVSILTQLCNRNDENIFILCTCTCSTIVPVWQVLLSLEVFLK